MATLKIKLTLRISFLIYVSKLQERSWLHHYHQIQVNKYYHGHGYTGAGVQIFFLAGTLNF